MNIHLRNNVFLSLTSLIIWVGIFPLQAQTKDPALRLYFDHLTSGNGLSDNDITCIYRDRRGFLWIGTAKGLDEYDGREVKIFTHNRFNPHSIINDHILSITEDDSGYLWLGTWQGISEFNPYNEMAVNYRHDPDNPFSLNDDYKNRVYIDKRGKIWVGNESGLSYFDPKTKQFTVVPILPDSLNKRTLTEVSQILEDREGRFWLGTFSGVILYNREKHTSQRFIVNHSGRKDANPVATVFEDHAGHIWAGIWGLGLCLLNPKTKQFTSFKWNFTSADPAIKNIVRSINETQPVPGKYILWVGTTEGLLKIDMPPDSLLTGDKSLAKAITTALKSLPFVYNEISLPHALKGKEIHALYADRQHILWIGGDQGLNEYLQRNQLFSFLPIVKGNVTKIIADSFHPPHHFFATAWYGNGLTELDSNEHPVRTWKQIPPHAPDFNNGQVSDIVRTQDGKLWIATFNGLYSYDEITGKYTAYLHRPGNPNSLTSNHLIAMGKDNAGHLWISDYRRGVDEFDPVKKTFKHYKHNNRDTNSLCNDLVWAIQTGTGGRMIFCTDNGLSIYNEKTHHFTNYTEQENNINSLKGHIISTVVAGRSGLMWVATDKGLNCFDPATKRFTLYSSEEGLKDKSILGMAADAIGRLWLVSRNGIASFNPANKSFINYNEQNGLSVTNLSGIIINDGRGNFLVGGKNELIKFTPSAFKSSKALIPVYITSVAVNGRIKKFGRPEEQAKEVLLKYPNNAFSCTFNAPEFFNGNAVRYAYRLDGIDAAWVAAGKHNSVTYANLAPGSYLFHVKAANSDDVWNQKGTSLLFVIRPPFWETWWFRIALLVFVCLLVYLLFVYRVTSIRKQESIKTAVNKQMADMRLKVLRTRMNPHFMFNALNSIQECIYTRQTDAASKYLSKFSRLLRLILERSENTFITISEEIELLKLYLELESLRFEGEFTYHILENNIESDLLKIPPMLVQPFVENALWHGLRHKEGEKNVCITFSADDHYIYAVIEDNGIGRKASRAFKADNAVKKQSLGIRLSTEQLGMVGALSKQQSGVKITDLYSDTGEPCGTKVVLSVPIVNNDES